MKKILLIGLLLATMAASAQDSIRYRSPFVAGMLSCVCPGAGQFYNKEKEKGWEYMGVTNRFQIEDPKNNYDPVYSPWDFKPGDIVSCKYQKLSDGLGHRSQHLVAKNLCE